LLGIRKLAVFSISVLLLASAVDSLQPARASTLRAVSSSATAASGGRLAKVRAIKRGLSVAAPKGQFAKGKVKQPLFSRYGVRTKRRQLASLAFNDGTILHVNQLTDLVLRSSNATLVKKGEVDQIVQPGTDHKIATPVAVASAIGTEWDTLCRKALCIFTVVEGVIRVTAKNGQSVLVRAGQQTTVRKGKSPTAPSAADGGAATAWVHALPPAPVTLGENLALDSNGGQVTPSSTRASGTKTWDVAHVHDGDTSTGWQTAAGKTGGESLTFSFGAGNIYRVTGIAIDPAATGGEDPSNDLKDFQVRGSRDGAPMAQIATGQTLQEDSLQIFMFDTPVDVDHIQLILQSNYGGKDGVSASEVEIVGQKIAIATPRPTNTPTKVPTPMPTATPTRVLNHLFKIDLTTPPQSYPADSTTPPEIETVHDIAQTCGPTPLANAWSGTQIDHVVDLQDGSSQDFSYSLSFSLSPGTPTVIFGDTTGAYIDLLVFGAGARLRWFGNPALGPSPPETEITGTVTDGGLC